MLQIWCIELAYDAPYMVYFGAWTLNFFSKKRLFEKLSKNVQFRARASASLCARARAILRLISEMASRRFPKILERCTKYGVSWRVDTIFGFCPIFGSNFSGT